MDDGTAMFIQLMIGLIGGSYVFYGWRQRHIMATVAGIGLSVVPMVVSGLGLIVLLSIPLLVLPWVVRY